MQGTIITIDSNEHAHHKEHKKKFENMGMLCLVKPLSYDFEVACPDGAILKIERKTPRDFLDSLKDGRLFNQAVDLVGGYIVIEGAFSRLYDGCVAWDVGIIRDRTNWSWHSLQGSLISLQEMGITII